MNNKD